MALFQSAIHNLNHHFFDSLDQDITAKPNLLEVIVLQEDEMQWRHVGGQLGKADDASQLVELLTLVFLNPDMVVIAQREERRRDHNQV